jgi:toxin secretion/phage lysis holin
MAVIKWIVALFLSIWASITVSVHFLLIMMAFDFMTGLASGFVQHKLDSTVGLRGLVKKSMVIVIVAVCYIATKPLNIAFDIGGTIAIAYGINELISTVENCACIGVPIPDILLQTLAKFKSIRFTQDQVAVERADIASSEAGKQVKAAYQEILDHRAQDAVEDADLHRNS